MNFSIRDVRGRGCLRGLGTCLIDNGEREQQSNSSLHCPVLRRVYLARRYTLSLPLGAGLCRMSFNSSPVRVTAFFTSVPSAFGKRAPSKWLLSVLSASLTAQVPKLATSPSAAALNSSGFASDRF